jgi:hypothetical protein
MTTLRSFVDGVMGSMKLYSLPNLVDVSFELSTLVKPPKDKVARPIDGQIDFYEGYWAHDARGTKLSHVKSWARDLLVRRPGNVPRRLRAIWWVVVALIVLAVMAATWGILDWALAGDAWWSLVVKAVATALPAVAAGWITDSLGDAARYLDDRPANVEMRQTIRRRIIEMLEHLHESDRYDRVIVIGHSLGGVIAYDAVRLLWQRRVCRTSFALASEEKAVVAKAAELLKAGQGKEAALQEFRESQRKLSRGLGGEVFDDGSSRSSKPRKWLVTDLVTVGSPIAYATLFFSSRTVPLVRRVDERGVSVCPPLLAVNPGEPDSYCFRSTHYPGKSFIHHGAVFSAVRWTNLYARRDLIGGHISAAPEVETNATGQSPPKLDVDAGLGLGVKNVLITKTLFANWPGLSHGRYWRRRDGQKTDVTEALESILNDE